MTTAIDSALRPEDYIKHDDFYRTKGQNNSTMAIDRAEFCALMRLAASVHAHLKCGAPVSVVDDEYKTYSELCGVHEAEANRITEKNKSAREIERKRKNAMRNMREAVASLEDALKGPKVPYRVKNAVEKMVAASDCVEQLQ